VLQFKAAEASIKKTSDLIRCLELENMLRIAKVVCQAALLREESRGSHYRMDYPTEDNERWLRNIEVRKGEKGLIYQKTGSKKS